MRMTSGSVTSWRVVLTASRVKQSDERMFASEQEARSWLVGEAELRGFGSVEPEVH